MRTLRAEQIKKTKTILRDYMCDNEGGYRRLSTAKKMQAGNLSTRIFCGAGLYKRREKKLQREKKMILPKFDTCKHTIGIYCPQTLTK